MRCLTYFTYIHKNYSILGSIFWCSLWERQWGEKQKTKLLSSWNNLTDSWLSLPSQTAAAGWVMRNNLMSFLRAEVGFGYIVFLSTASNYWRYNNTKTFIIIHDIGIYLTSKGLNHEFIMNVSDLHRFITVIGVCSAL